MDIIGTEGDDNFDNSIEGTDASERIFGLGGEDWFVASLGNDTLDGGASNQDVVFYDFNDSISSVFINNTGGEIDGVAAFTVDKGVGIDTLISVENFHGSDGNDTIYAGNSATYVFDRAGDDEIFAGDTPDSGNGLIFAAGSGNDTMWGSTFDDDIVDYDGDGFDAGGLIFQGVTVDLGNGTATDGWGGQDQLNSIEWVSGSRLNDSILGDDGNNRLSGNDGDDTLNGAGGNDTIDGGDGDDFLIGGDGDDLIITGNNGFEDFVDAGAGIDVIDMRGTAGNPEGFVAIGHDNLGDQGITVQLTYDNSDVDSIDKGTAGQTTLLGVENALDGFGMYIGGTDEDDTFNVTSKDGSYIQLAGFDGTDSYNIGYSTSDIRLDLRGGDQAVLLNTNLGSGQIINDGYGNTETYVEGVNPDDNSQTAIVNQFQLGVFSDVVIGSDNDETFRMLGGDDTVKAGGGSDRLRFDRSEISGITLDMTNKGSLDDDLSTTEIDESIDYDGTAVGFSDTGNGPVAFTVYFQDVERFRGSREDDEMIADGSGVEFFGRQGNDTLVDGSGDDELTGGTGLDTFVYSGGNDTITDFDLAEETVDLSSWGFADEQAESDFIVNNISDSGADAVIDFGNGNSLTLEGISAQQIIDEINNDDGGGGGNPGDDIFGTEGDDNTFDGGNTISGTSASERLFGLGGTDWFNASLGNDTINGGPGNGDNIFYNVEAISGPIFINNTENEIDGVAAFTVDKGVGIDTLIEIEAFHGSNGDDTIYAGNAGESVFDRAGNDEIFAGDTPDSGNGLIFAAGSGNDTMWGSTFDDDIVDYNGDGFDAGGSTFQGVTVDLGNGTATDGWGGQDQLNSIEWVSGSRLNDSILGDDGNNLLSGNDGSDTIDGGAGNDFIFGDDGDDTIDGGVGDDNIFGGVGDDTIDGGQGDDNLFGGAGNDSIIAGGSSGFDFIETGEGTDVVDFTSASGPYSAGVSFGDLDFGDEGPEEENLVGVTFDVDTAFADGSVDKGALGTTTLINVSEVIQSDEGGLDLFGSTENDTYNVTNNLANSFLALRGGDGADFYNIGSGIGSIRLDFRGGETGVELNLALAENQVRNDGFGNIEDIDGIENIREFRTGDGDDNITGSARDERFITRLGSDTVDGGGGFDTLRFDRGFVESVVVDLEDAQGGAAGYALGQWTNDGQPDTFETFIDNIDAVRGSRNGDDQLRGDAESNRFEGRGGNDLLQGRGGSDMLMGEGGNDTLEGGVDNDTLDGGDGADTLRGGSGSDSLIGGENGDRLEGGTDSDYLDGGNGNDSLFGGGVGNDTLIGGAGEDALIGEGGNDDMDGGTEADTLRGGAGEDTLMGGDGGDRLEGGTENDTIDGGNDNDTIFGGSGADMIMGGRGTDEIRSESENDTIDGGDGFDAIYAGGGDDSVDGGNGNDFMTGGEGFDTLNGGVGNDRLFGGPSGNDVLDGGEGDDQLFGEAGRDIMNGGAGEDLLNGGNGNDDLVGGLDDDTLNGGQGNDNMFGGEGVDVMNGNQGSDFLFGEDGNDVMDGGDGFDLMNGGAGDDVMRGGNGGDRLEGNLGEDTLEGGTGDDFLFGGNGAFADTLNGGAGNDELAGEGGSDTFIFEDGFGQDTIFGFDAFDSNEKIDLSGVTSIDDFTDLAANHMEDVGSDVVITDGVNTITILNAQEVNLGADDFIFSV